MGQPVAELAYGAFSEWALVPARHALPVPVLAPEIVALLTSGLTASIGEDACALMRTQCGLMLCLINTEPHTASSFSTPIYQASAQ